MYDSERPQPAERQLLWIVLATALLVAFIVALFWDHIMAAVHMIAA